ncbi:hypothetical protein BC332_28366 [Capsicum chinense]|nr:hypothetical protein BC332_28366 [Capsicum chinense]
MKTIFSWQSPKENSENTGSYDAINVILNHDFSKGLHLRHTNCCNVFVVPACSSNYKGVAEDIGCSYTIITNCTECWKGLQQDFTSRISAGCVYVVSARVVVSGTFHGSIDVQATLRLVYQNAEISYLFISKKSITKEGWQVLKGSLSLPTLPDQVAFYLEGPSHGFNLLTKLVIINCPSLTDYEINFAAKSSCTDDERIIINTNFDDKLNSWSGKGCKVVCHDCMTDGNINPISGKYFASTIERTQSWNKIQHNIIGRVKQKLACELIAIVRLHGHNANSVDVRGTLLVQAADDRDST